jgi:hypothetical protein
MNISKILHSILQLHRATRESRIIPVLLLALTAVSAFTPVLAEQADTRSSNRPADTISNLDFESPEVSSLPIAAEDQPHAEEPGSNETEDKCDWELEGQPLQEQSQQIIYGMSCHSFRWFDHLFGSKHDFPEEQVNGLVLMGFEYREYDGFDPRGRFRVRAPLPNLNERWDVIVGRENEEEFVSDTAPRDQTLYNPGLSRDDDNEWLLGLGHRKKNRRKGLDYSVGVRVGAPPNLYGKVQYYYNRQFTEKTDLGFRQTLFWRTDEGLGTTSRANLTHQASSKDVLRWEGVATVSDDTEGMKWYAAQTWYHQLQGKNAISLQAFARGETDEEVALRDYGLNLMWRQPFTRDWMFLAMGPNITWPRTYRYEERELSLGFSLWVEMEFGDYQY